MLVHRNPNLAQNDPAELARQMEKVLNFPVLTERLPEGWHFRGAEFCPVGVCQSAHLIYFRIGKPRRTVSVFSLPPAAWPGKHGTGCSEMDPTQHPIAGFATRSGAYFVVGGNRPPMSLSEVATTLGSPQGRHRPGQRRRVRPHEHRQRPLNGFAPRLAGTPSVLALTVRASPGDDRPCKALTAFGQARRAGEGRPFDLPSGRIRLSPMAEENSGPSKPPAPSDGSVKETIESILVAFILAFIFRAFVVEAFVIPTGSMGPTLMGGTCGSSARTAATTST